MGIRYEYIEFDGDRRPIKFSIDCIDEAEAARHMGHLGFTTRLKLQRARIAKIVYVCSFFVLFCFAY